MEYHIITRLIQGKTEYQIVVTLKGGNPLYGYSGHWERYKRGPSWEIKIFNSYDKACSYLNYNINVTEHIIASQVEPAKVSILFGILEELKTTNDILASALGELRKFTYPETPQPDIELPQEQEGLIQEIVYYVLGRSEYSDDTGWKVEYQVSGYLRNNIKIHGDWDISSKAFNTYADAVNFMNTLSIYAQRTK